jgi:hypothetical protein
MLRFVRAAAFFCFLFVFALIAVFSICICCRKSEAALPPSWRPHVVNAHVQVQAQVRSRIVVDLGSRIVVDLGSCITADLGSRITADLGSRITADLGSPPYC